MPELIQMVGRVVERTFLTFGCFCLERFVWTLRIEERFKLNLLGPLSHTQTHCSTRNVIKRRLKDKKALQTRQDFHRCLVIHKNYFWNSERNYRTKKMRKDSSETKLGRVKWLSSAVSGRKIEGNSSRAASNRRSWWKCIFFSLSINHTTERIA